MDVFKEKKSESRRFQTLIRLLLTARRLRYKVYLLTFINTLISANEDIATRVRIREEFVSLGIRDAIDRLKDHPPDKIDDDHLDLDTQIEIWEDEEREDDEVIQDKFNALSREVNTE